MGIFHVFQIVQIVSNRAKHHIYLLAYTNISMRGKLKGVLQSEKN